MASSWNLSTNGVADAGTTTGNWVDVSNVEVPYTIHFRGAGVGDTYQVYVSNEDPQPSNATDRATYGSAVNADNAVVKVTENYRWLKAKKTASTQSSVPWLFGVFHK